MNKILLFLCAFIPFLSFGQTGLTTGGATVTVNQVSTPTYYVGRTYNNSAFTNTNDFAVNTCGASASGGHLSITSPGSGAFTASLQLADTERVDHIKIVAKVHLTSTQSSSTFGVSLGLQGVNANALCSIVMFYNMSTSNNGHVQLFNQNNSSTWSQQWSTTANTPVTNSTNDAIVLTWERINNQMHFSVYNATTNAASWDTLFTVAQNSSTVLMPNTAVPVLYANGGNLQLDSLTVIKNVPTRGVMFVGDSKGIWGQTSFALTYPSICSYFLDKTVVSQGFGDLTANMLSGWKEIKTCNPIAVLFEGGSNDQRFNGSLNTVAITKLMDSCQAYGIIFIPIGPMFESAQDLSGQLAFFASLPNNIYMWDISKRPGFNTADGIHIASIATPWVARRIRESNLLPGPNNRNEYYQSGFTNY